MNQILFQSLLKVKNVSLSTKYLKCSKNACSVSDMQQHTKTSMAPGRQQKKKQRLHLEAGDTDSTLCSPPLNQRIPLRFVVRYVKEARRQYSQLHNLHFEVNKVYSNARSNFLLTKVISDL